VIERLREAVKAMLPAAARSWLRAKHRRITVWPPVGLVRFGSLRRLTPISSNYGYERGQPIDRYYIEDFLSRHAGMPGYAAGDIRGHVLEVGGREYTDRFGAAETRVDVLHVDRSNPQATIVGDLTSGNEIPSDTFDCIICTQVFPVVYDVSAAVSTLHRALKPGGVALVTMPGITASCVPDRDVWGDYWRFTTLSTRRLFEAVFPGEAVSVEAYGNVLAAIAFLHGLAVKDLKRSELHPHDPNYELVISVRAVKHA
jgi:SAM-dependent methyltransferase